VIVGRRGSGAARLLVGEGELEFQVSLAGAVALLDVAAPGSDAILHAADGADAGEARMLRRLRLGDPEERAVVLVLVRGGTHRQLLRAGDSRLAAPSARRGQAGAAVSLPNGRRVMRARLSPSTLLGCASLVGGCHGAGAAQQPAPWRCGASWRRRVRRPV